MKIAVLGATGYIGSHLVPVLLARGYEVRALARHVEVLDARGWTGIETRAADVLEPASLDAAFEGCDVLYYLVHSMGAGADFAERDRRAADNVRSAAERMGIQRIVYLGGLQPPTEASAHLASRAETGEHLRGGSIPVTELRAGIIVGPGSAAFEVIRDLVYHLPGMVTPRWVRSRTQPIALEDVIEYLVRVIEVPETAGQTYDVGGPEILSYEAMLRDFAAVVGRRIFILRVSVLSPRLSSYWLDLVTAVPASVVRPLIDGLRHDLLANDAPIRALIPIPLRSYRQAIEAALAEERTTVPSARWAEGVLAFRRYQPEISFYSKLFTAERDTTASPAVVWSVVTSLGGRRGWVHYDSLWRLRGALDRLVGGVGMRRGRRHPTDVRVGDAIDFWRVAAVEPGRRLTLVAEMKLPGSAVLEFEVTPLPSGGSKLSTSARYHPAGVVGLLYWYALVPVHPRIFRGMTNGIVERAEALEAASLAANSSRIAE